MKGTALLLLCVATLAQADQPQLTLSGKVCNCNPSEAKNVCSQNGSDDQLIAHEHCNQFYKCFDGSAIAYECPANLLYNPLAEICDWPSNVNCGNRPIVSPDEKVDCSQENKGTDDSNNGGTNEDNNEVSCNCNPEEAPAICAADGSDGVLVAHQNCNQFYKCDHGVPAVLNCPSGLMYNPPTEQCDWAHNVECGSRPIVEIDDSGNNNGGDEDCEESGNGNGSGENGDNGGTCNCNPDEAPAICSSAGSDGVLVAHENCNQFYKCAHGVPVPLFCHPGLLYNPHTERCDWPHEVDCGDRPIVEGGGGNGGNSDEDNTGGENGGEDNGGNCNCKPEEAPGICSAPGSDGVLVAHENCNQFYKCSHGVPVPLFCHPGLLYNPHTERCDWPHEVDCGNRPIVEGGGGNGDNSDEDNTGGENGGEDNGGNCNCKPEEAPGICGAAGSDGVLVAHENCNQFYKCAHGVPVPLFCHPGLLYNPHTERCDWPHEVDCGDRPIVECGGENGGNSDEDNTGGDNGGEDNGGNCNCKPEEAPAICGAPGSDGVLVAHENCNQFYKCAHGLPVPLFCHPGLLYNPHTERCDWPHEVDCGDRPIVEGGGGNGGNSDEDNTEGDNGGEDNGGNCNCKPEEAPGICGAPGSDGVLVAHENCNQFYKCSHGVPVPLFCHPGLLYNPHTERCDWPHEVDCGDRPIVEGGGGNGGNSDEDNTGGDNGGEDNGGNCNCKPEEAPAICGAPGSDGVLVAHENCNQFYKCAHGVPVPLFCHPGLLYNPHTERCDWPHEVDCGDRPIVEGGGGNGGNSEEDNTGGDNGGEDNGGNCNCKPEEAPGICGAPGSDGVLVAHENCNQFYKCAHGVPVPLFCHPGLLYNPHTERCDWPHEVDCGDRPIVEGGGGNGGNSDEDNTGGDNGGEDNGGNCNCKPEEAPGICGAPGSDGVLVAHENCNQFYKCAHGVPVPLFCHPGLLYNPHTERCDWPHEVDCGDRPIVEGGGGNGGNSEEDNTGGDNGGEDNGGNCNCKPEEAPGICGAPGSDGVLVAHENCNQFYKCAHGVPVPLFCHPGLLYNPHTERCDWPHEVDCGDRPIVEGGGGNGGNSDEDNTGGDNGGEDNGGNCNCKPEEAPGICGAPGSDGVLVAHENCNQFYKCAHGVPVPLFCHPGLLYNPHTERCDWPHEVDCGDRPIVEGGGGNGGNSEEDNTGGDNGGEDNGGNCNCKPEEAPGICGAPGSDGVLVAHENCNQFYKCAHGVPVPLFCHPGLLYNPHTERCDWPHEVDCGDRPIVEGGGGNGGNSEEDNTGGDNGGEDNGGNCNCKPEEAPGICGAPGSDGVLVAHENCNQFYKCAHGVPVPLFCHPGLLYNPHTERCDWPHEVDCGDRPIVEGGGGNGGNSDEDNTGGDNGGEDNGGNCNCKPEEAPGICGAPGSDGVLVAHENCNQFYKCAHGVPVPLFCHPGLLYNPHTERCDWPHEVDCGDRPIVECGGGNGGNSEEDNTGGDNGGEDNGGNCNCKPEEAPGICGAPGSDGVLVAHENCNQFYKCAHGVPVPLFCHPGLLYNPHTERCDWPHEVDCGDRPIVEGGGGNGGNSEEDNTGGDNGGEDNGGNCNCKPEEAPGICGAPGSDGVLVAHENCNQFYKCAHGVPVPLFCHPGLLYNPHTERCDWPHEVDCGDRPIVEGGGGNGGNSDEDNTGGDNGGEDNGGNCNCKPEEAPGICGAPGSDGVLVAHENCNQFYKCAHGVPVPLFCHPGLLYNPHTERCDWPHEVDCGDRPIIEGGGGNGGNSDEDNTGGENGGEDNGGNCNCKPEEAPGICGAPGSDGVLVAHENCNQFYKCAHGVPVPLFCHPGLLYNPHTERCDWPHEVDCGDRPIVEGGGGNGGNSDEDNTGGDNGGEDNGGNCNCKPEEAPGICGAAGSDGVLVAHENCNQFYKCSHGVPVPLFCHPGLLYNPYTERCDWPHEVDCGDRPIVEGGGGNGDNSDEDNTGGGNDGEDNGGTCNCKPEEAPGICGAAGSDGVLVAHENCNQFYKCAHGVPVPLFCHPGLLYNPHTERCDWPHEVDCGDRPIVEGGGGNGGNSDEDNTGGDNGGEDNGGNCNCKPEEAPGICGAADSDGVLVAHENCNQFYKCSHGVPVALFCQPGLLYNPHTERCDWPHEVDCGDRPIVEGGGGNGGNSDEDNTGGDNGGEDNGGNCNCKPEEAPGICGAAGSDGVLVAHENCNQFYKCSHGVPVPLFCQSGLLYNPHTERCDWPHEVDCGDRPIVEGGGGNGGNSDEDNTGGDNGGEDNGGNCNCKPEEAPGICGAAGSDGVLVAHENCNQFYKCAHGVPVPLFCQSGLLYNPHTERCDWPHEVDCGDRPIVEGGGGNGGNSDEDNTGGDNGGEDNGGNCNCKPEEAPGICGAADSDGVLVAHENCNQFYKCSHGVPVPLFCHPGLLYNPHTERCDWPHEVDCGDRPIVEGGGGNGDNSDEDNTGGDNGGEDNGGSCNCKPEEAPGICGAAGSDGVLVAHENCNQFYKCSHGVPVPLFCHPGLLYNPYTERCDWPHEVDCGSRPIVEGGGGNGDNSDEDNNGNGSDGGNSDPSEAPAICANSGSNGVFVAHENCDQFYVCSEGKPIALKCPSNLMYNPATEQCDWPRNVNCGDRVVPKPDNDGGDDGPCSCNAREAPSICAGSNSNGKLIAHENCNQYYVCFKGVPVARSCPQNLFYDPHMEQCLWPVSVSCEGRVITSVSSYASLNKHTQARRGFF